MCLNATQFEKNTWTCTFKQQCVIISLMNNGKWDNASKRFTSVDWNVFYYNPNIWGPWLGNLSETILNYECSGLLDIM